MVISIAMCCFLLLFLVCYCSVLRVPELLPEDAILPVHMITPLLPPLSTIRSILSNLLLSLATLQSRELRGHLLELLNDEPPLTVRDEFAFTP